jgi:hypothetical protein
LFFCYAKKQSKAAAQASKKGLRISALLFIASGARSKKSNFFACLAEGEAFISGYATPKACLLHRLRSKAKDCFARSEASMQLCRPCFVFLLRLPALLCFTAFFACHRLLAEQEAKQFVAFVFLLCSPKAVKQKQGMQLPA